MASLSVRALDDDIQALLIINYATAALVCILVYEFVSLLSREIEAIWSGKWVNINTIYLFCRYIPFLDLSFTFSTRSNLPFCSFATYAIVWTSFAGLVASELCFILRAYALWGASRPAAIFLSTLTLGMIGGLAADAVKTRPGDISKDSSVPFFSVLVCQLEGPESFAMWASVIVLVIDAVTVSMVIWATIALYHAQEANPLLIKIYRDSISYFLLNCLIAAAAIVIYLKFSSLTLVSSRFSAVLTSVLSSRMILTLKEYGNNSPFFSQNLTSVAPVTSLLSDIQFASRFRDAGD